MAAKHMPLVPLLTHDTACPTLQVDPTLTRADRLVGQVLGQVRAGLWAQGAGSSGSGAWSGAWRAQGAGSGGSGAGPGASRAQGAGPGGSGVCMFRLQGCC